MRNWAGNHPYAGAIVRPDSIDELRRVVQANPRVGFLGSRHAFNAIADSDVLIDMQALPVRVEIDVERRQVTVGGGTTYGELAPVIDAEGFALANLASLPHITVAGAIATGTHGSGVANGGLGTAVAALEIVRADGELVSVARGEPDFDGCVVGLGALGAVVGVVLDLEPTYQVRQWVSEDLPWTSVLEQLDDVLGCAYSVSLFTRWDGTVQQAWFKERLDRQEHAPRAILDLGRPATSDVHPVPHTDPVNCTAQRGVAGPWFDRLPHFRIGFTPSNGDELQSEYLVDRAVAPEAIAAIAQLGDAIRPALQISEVRTIAADELWMSPSYGRDSLALHFTWLPAPEPVAAAMTQVETALLPLGARPHWGKLFAAEAADVAPRYPRFEDFVALADRFDPHRALDNAWLTRHVFGARRGVQAAHSRPIEPALREALLAARRARDAGAIAALRSALAAIDNAGAVAPPPLPAADCASEHVAGTAGPLGAGEAPRAELSEDDRRAIVAAEVDERRVAARQYAAGGREAAAAALLAEADVLERLLSA